QASEALVTLAGNQWSRKFETTASPASRSEAGRMLQNGFGWTPGDEARGGRGTSGLALMESPSGGDGEAGIAVHRAGEVLDELGVFGRYREVVAGERLRRGARDVGAVAVVLRSVAGAEEPVRQAQRLAVHGLRLRLRERFGPDRAAQVRADRGNRVEDIPL